MRFINNVFIRWGSALFLLLLNASSNAQFIHISHCMSGCPKGDDQNDLIVRHLYAAEINSENGHADWVAYRILPGSVGVASLLPRRWEQETLLPAPRSVERSPNLLALYQADLSEAEDRGYRINEFMFNADDRGRLAPMTSFSKTPYWSELNYLSNMARLPSDLRLGSWSRLNQAVNELVSAVGSLYVVSGPLYGGPNEFASGGDIFATPSNYFKVVATPNAYAGFIFPSQLPIHAEYCAQIASIDEIQERSGLNLFPDFKKELTPGLIQGLHCN